MEKRHCKFGHEKARRTHGWHCPTCQREQAQQRYAREVAEGKRSRRKPKGTSASTPVDDKCKLGHPRVRRPSGTLACPTCQNAWKAARRAAERNRDCVHALRPYYEGIVNEKGQMVCLACLCAQANAA